MSSMINFFRGIWLIQVQQKQPHGRITSCKHSFQDADHLLPVRRCRWPSKCSSRDSCSASVPPTGWWGQCRSMAHLGSANAARFPQGLGEARTRYHWFRRITTESTAVAAWGVSGGAHPIVNGPLVNRNTGKLDEEGRRWQGAQVLLSWSWRLPKRRSPPGLHPSSSRSSGPSASFHTQSDEWAGTPICPWQSENIHFISLLTFLVFCKPTRSGLHNNIWGSETSV